MIRTGLLPPGAVVHLGRQIRIDEAEWIKAGGQAFPTSRPRRPPVRLRGQVTETLQPYGREVVAAMAKNAS